MSLSPQDLIIVTCKSLTGNWVRSALTSLGVFMGVAAVNATLQVGDISRALIKQQLSKRDAPQVSLSVFSREGREPKLEDLEFLRRRLKNYQLISASNYVGFSESVIYQGEEGKPMMLAVTQDYLPATGRRLIKGRYFNAADLENYRPVVVIDKFLSDKLFKKEEPLGKSIFSSNRPYQVIGIIETKQSFGEEPKGQLVMPMSTYSALTGSQDFQSIWIRPRKEEDMNQLKEDAEKLLKSRFPGAEVYGYSNIEDILMQKQSFELASRGLNVVGIIALLIGGVGITNITIASVIERTAEIGLRRALGATKSEILLQFILEAALLSLVGGTLAIISVNCVTIVVTQIFSFPYQLEVQTAVLSLGAALLVGVGACYFPAVRASQLDPVKALREG
ncbi:ABC transporter permease [Dulcicalothrix desertica PCC 7102]|uniref:ABC transporter permease n=1 Tax=Dulcicalothrix desertica PCC 7102 TaxID=232991 RepID=A0A3S1CLY1_9CYAN|nr:ABC transporter permease [Dulcicalothrix desertica]RUT10150.1 ABC transporter permease [Dulcicalothrix desertica PCC 7102]TWH40871.1 putative ABC transport system permease protein [Dulcicalothrix desertica PCC 7102]